MTHEEAKAYNKAIDDAVNSYTKGIGAIKALRIKYVFTVDHVGTTTTQTKEVV